MKQFICWDMSSSGFCVADMVLGMRINESLPLPVLVLLVGARALCTGNIDKHDCVSPKCQNLLDNNKFTSHSGIIDSTC